MTLPEELIRRIFEDDLKRRWTADGTLGVDALLRDPNFNLFYKDHAVQAEWMAFFRGFEYAEAMVTLGLVAPPEPAPSPDPE